MNYYNETPVFKTISLGLSFSNFLIVYRSPFLCQGPAWTGTGRVGNIEITDDNPNETGIMELIDL